MSKYGACDLCGTENDVFTIYAYGHDDYIDVTAGYLCRSCVNKANFEIQETVKIEYTSELIDFIEKNKPERYV